MVSAYGLGIQPLCEALDDPDAVRHALYREEPPAFRVHLDEIPDKTLLKRIRRAGRLSKMEVLAAQNAMTDLEPEKADGNGTGLLLATALGPHPTTFSFLDDILRYGDSGVSPTVFSNSVHNAPAAYVAETLGLLGPTLTVTRFFHAFHEAVRIAECWLGEGRCDRVLVGAADEYGEVLRYVLKARFPGSTLGRMSPLNLSSPGVIPAEGAVFFLLGAGSDPGGICHMKAMGPRPEGLAYPPHDLRVVDSDGLVPDGSGYRPSPLLPGSPVVAYTHAFGSLFTGSAFSAAIAAVMLKEQYGFAGPSGDNPLAVATVETSGPRTVEGIVCERLNCYQEKMLIYMTRKPDVG